MVALFQKLLEPSLVGPLVYVKTRATFFDGSAHPPFPKVTAVLVLQQCVFHGLRSHQLRWSSGTDAGA